MDGSTTVYSSDLEDVSDWNMSGWEVVPYNQKYPHYYMLEWRNDKGSIASEGHKGQYYSLTHDQDGWAVDKFAANVPGMLVWYRNTFYSNNNPVSGGRYYESPATGPKGELLLVDSHFEPVTWSNGFWNPETGKINPRFSNRRGAMDGAFSMNDTPAWMIHDNAVLSDTVMDFGSRPAVPMFDDTKASVPGWLWTGDGSVYHRIDQASSVVIPAAHDYSTRIRGLDETGTMPGDDFTDFWGFTVGGQVLGSGNPGLAAYGVSVEIVEQGADGSWGKVRIMNDLNAEFSPSMPAPTNGADQMHHVDIANHTTKIQTFNIMVEGNKWMTTVSETVELAPESMVHADIMVHVPVTATNGMSDTVMVKISGDAGEAMSEFTTVIGCRFDSDWDGRVSILDLSRTASFLGDSGAYESYFDFNHDEVIDILDVSVVATALNSPCPPPPGENNGGMELMR
jgi:hypothetical protein